MYDNRLNLQGVNGKKIATDTLKLSTLGRKRMFKVNSTHYLIGFIPFAISL